MSASINKVILIGNVGGDPDIVAMPSGKTKADFSLATSFGQGEDQKTEWHRVVLWEKLADIAAAYVTKGSSVYIEGRLQYRSYDDKDGNKRYVTEVVGERIQLLSPKAAAPPAEEPKPKPKAKAKAKHDHRAAINQDSELPF